MTGREPLSQAIDLTIQSLVRGRFSFDLVKDHLQTITEVGSILSTLNRNLVLENYEPFMRKIARLTFNIHQLSNKTKDLAVEFEERSTLYSQFSKLFRAVGYLNQIMEDAMILPSVSRIQKFQDGCQKAPPMDMISKLISFVESDLSSDNFESKEIFENWKTAVESLLTQFIFIEAFSIGLLSKDNKDELSRITGKINKLLEKMTWGEPERWSDDWRKTVKELVEKIQDNNIHQDNSRKADLLRDILEVLFKNFTFYVVVFNGCDFGNDLAINGIEEQYICSMQRGLCNVIVYRSLQWKHTIQSSRCDFVREVEACENNVLPYWADYTGFPNILRSDHISNTGFVGLIREDQNAQVRAVNSEDEEGPGRFMTVNDKVGDQFVLIAGYK